MPTSAETSRKPFYTTKTLADRLYVARQTIHRWRLCGYLPPPCFAEGTTTLWSTDDIEDWLAAGCPWGDLELAEEARRIHGGAIGLNTFLKPEFRLRLEPESPRAAEILDRFERRLNACQALLNRMPSEADVRQLAGRLTAVRRELATLRGHQEK